MKYLKKLLFASNRLVYETGRQQPEATAGTEQISESVGVGKNDADTPEGRKKIYKKVEDLIKELQKRGKKKEADGLTADLALARATESSAKDTEYAKQTKAVALYNMLLDNVAGKIIESIKAKKTGYITTLEALINDGTNPDMRIFINETISKLNEGVLNDVLVDDAVLQTLPVPALIAIGNRMDQIMADYDRENPDAHKLTDKEKTELDGIIKAYSEIFNIERDWIKKSSESSDSMTRATAFVYNQMIAEQGMLDPQIVATTNDKRVVNGSKIVEWTEKLFELKNKRQADDLPQDRIAIAYNSFSGGRNLEPPTTVASETIIPPPPKRETETATPASAKTSDAKPPRVGLGDAPQVGGPAIREPEANVDSTERGPRYRIVNDEDVRDAVKAHFKVQPGINELANAKLRDRIMVPIDGRTYYVTVGGDENQKTLGNVEELIS